MADPYAIRNSRGNVVATIETGNRDRTQTSLVLHGRGAPEYGLDRDQNLVYLLDNFSNDDEPVNPIDGQLWWKRGVEFFIFDEQEGSPNDPTGSPKIGGAFVTVVPPPLSLGFDVVAGDGLIGGGFPTSSPLQTTLNVGFGTGIQIGSPSSTGDLSGLNKIRTKDDEIIHDNLSGFVADEHIDHSTITISAGAGIFVGSPLDFPTPGVGDDVRPITQDIIIHVGTGDGIQFIGNQPGIGSPEIGQLGLDSTVVTTDAPGVGSPIQVVGGIKTFGERTWGDATAIAGEPSYTFDGDEDTGIFMPSNNTIGWVTDGTNRFTIDTSQRMTALTPNYETLVTQNDDIPNKKYVDDNVGTGGSGPTENTFTGISSLSGLDGAQTYLVCAYGIVPHHNVLGNSTLSAIRVRTGNTNIGLGTIRASTAQLTINWPDGSFPTYASFIVDMSGDTTLNVQVNNPIHGGPGPVCAGPPSDVPANAGSTLVVAVQLTNN